VYTVMNLRVPEIPGKFLSSCTTGGFSRKAQLHVVSQLFTYVKILSFKDCGVLPVTVAER
jgi:hypothetical protein